MNKPGQQHDREAARVEAKGEAAEGLVKPDQPQVARLLARLAIQQYLLVKRRNKDE